MQTKEIESRKNEIEKELESLGLITPINGGYTQSANNCYEIASRVANIHGYKIPNSKDYFLLMYYTAKRRQSVNNPNGKKEETSRDYIVFRESESSRGWISDLHVTFEKDGEEFNYGVSDNDGFEVWARFPLIKSN